jgi:hypothetical protein
MSPPLKDTPLSDAILIRRPAPRISGGPPFASGISVTPGTEAAIAAFRIGDGDRAGKPSVGDPIRRAPADRPGRGGRARRCFDHRTASSHRCCFHSNIDNDRFARLAAFGRRARRHHSDRRDADDVVARPLLDGDEPATFDICASDLRCGVRLRASGKHRHRRAGYRT